MRKIFLNHRPTGPKAGSAAGPLLLALCLLSSPGRAVETRPLELARFPSLVSAVRIAPPLSFCGEAVPLDDQDVRERLEKELLLSLWDRPQVILWLKRSTRTARVGWNGWKIQGLVCQKALHCATRNRWCR